MSAPTPRARALAKELRATRQARRLSQTELGAAIGWSKHKTSRLELAKHVPNERELGAILDALQVQGTERDRLMKLARESDQRAWWEATADSAQFAAFVDAEDRATRVQQLSVNLIPGLLQTRDYARHVIERHDGDRDIEQSVNIRVMRQGVLTRARPIDYVVYLDESCLARCVGDHGVMTEQLRELQRMGQRGNVTLRVMPFSYGAYTNMVGGFRLAHFVREDTIAQLEQAGAVGIISDPDDVAPFLRAADSLKVSAMSENGTLDMIAGYLTRYESESKQ